MRPCDPGDRELLAELARLNQRMASLCRHTIDKRDSTDEDMCYAERLITTAGERWRRRANGLSAAMVEGKFVTDRSLVLPAQAVEPPWSREKRW